MWWASARIERNEERVYLAELTNLIAEYQATYHGASECQTKGY